MGLTFLPVCMDSSEWLQVTANEENGMDSSSSPSGDMLTCSRPLIERRLRPQHDQALKCPRCDSTHTKFCYYNNYSLSQPRYFCKTCRRYWTKGGTLRNIPVGGGCRKNKKVTSKKSNDHHPIMNQNPGGPLTHNPTDLHLSFPDQVQFSTAHISNLLGTPAGIGHNHGLPVVDFMEGKIEAIIGNSRNYDFMGNNCEMSMAGLGDHHGGLALAPNFHGLCSPFGVTAIDGNSGTFMLPYQENLEQNAMDVKPNTKLLSLDWQDQGCSDVGKDSFVYLNNVGSWNGMISNGYGPSTTNPLV